MEKWSFTLLFVILSFSSRSQNDTDIFLYDVDFSKGKLLNEVNFTKWSGYDNQPHFSADAKLVYFTRRFRNQSDAYYYDVSRKLIRELTATEKTSEYSPTLTPDGNFVSVVRVEEDSTQRLWKFPASMGEPELIFENIQPVGYHAWIDDITVALFVLGNPNSLNIANTVTGESQHIAYDIGRSLHSVSGSLYFVHKETPDSWWLKQYDKNTGETTRVAETIKGREDFTVTRSGKILMGDGEKIYQLKSGKWKKVFTIKNEEIKDFNRMTLSPDEKKLALVTVMN